MASAAIAVELGGIALTGLPFAATLPLRLVYSSRPRTMAVLAARGLTELALLLGEGGFGNWPTSWADAGGFATRLVARDAGSRAGTGFLAVAAACSSTGGKALLGVLAASRAAILLMTTSGCG